MPEQTDVTHQVGVPREKYIHFSGSQCVTQTHSLVIATKQLHLSPLFSTHISFAVLMNTKKDGHMRNKLRCWERKELIETSMNWRRIRILCPSWWLWTCNHHFSGSQCAYSEWREEMLNDLCLFITCIFCHPDVDSCDCASDCLSDRWYSWFSELLGIPDAKYPS